MQTGKNSVNLSDIGDFNWKWSDGIKLLKDSWAFPRQNWESLANITQTSSWPVSDTINEERSKVLETTNNLEVCQYDIESLVSEQYERVLESLRVFWLYDKDKLNWDSEVPSIQEVIQRLLWIPEEKREIINLLEKPQLILIPLTSSDRYISAFEEIYRKGKLGKHILRYFYNDVIPFLKDYDVKNKFNEWNKIIWWKVAIIEWAKNPKWLSWEDIDTRLIMRRSWFREKFESKWIFWVNTLQYILYRLYDVLNITPDQYIDNDTILCEKVNAHFLPVAYFVRNGKWSDSCVTMVLANLYYSKYSNSFPDYRFRLSVMEEDEFFSSDKLSWEECSFTAEDIELQNKFPKHILNDYNELRKNNSNIPNLQNLMQGLQEIEPNTWKTKYDLMMWLQNWWRLIWFEEWKFLFADWWHEPRFQWMEWYIVIRDEVHKNGYELHTEDTKRIYEEFTGELFLRSDNWDRFVSSWIESWNRVATTDEYQWWCKNILCTPKWELSDISYAIHTFCNPTLGARCLLRV